jgi:hypothetical protein
MSDYCAGVATDLVRRGQLGGSWPLRGRIAAPAPGQITSFGGTHALTFNRRFAEQLDRWALNTNHWSRSYPSAAGEKAIAWFGEVGSMACHRPTAAHNRARGLDLCQIRFTDGGLVDMNSSHRGNRRQQRRYLAVSANLRRYFGTVLTCHYNAAHRDHIHVDDLTAVAPIRTDKRTDTTLVQSAANLLGGERLAIDGVWGSQTEAAYQRLLRDFALECTDPKRSTRHALTFLSFVVRTGFADVPAGRFKARACDPCNAPADAAEAVRCEADDVLGLG